MVALLSATLGWSEAQILAMPRHQVEAYCLHALRMRGIDPDRLTRATFEVEGGPPADGAGGVPEEVKAIWREHGITPQGMEG